MSPSCVSRNPGFLGRRNPTPPAWPEARPASAARGEAGCFIRLKCYGFLYLSFNGPLLSGLPSRPGCFVPAPGGLIGNRELWDTFWIPACAGMAPWVWPARRMAGCFIRLKCYTLLNGSRPSLSTYLGELPSFYAPNGGGRRPPQYRQIREATCTDFSIPSSVDRKYRLFLYFSSIWSRRPRGYFNRPFWALS